MPRKHQAGCGCCGPSCVALVVDDDNTDKWSQSGSTIKILQAVPFQRFSLSFAAYQNIGTIGNAISTSGTIKIWVLNDPDDLDEDAILELTLTNENAFTPSTFTRSAALPFFEETTWVGGPNFTNPYTIQDRLHVSPQPTNAAFQDMIGSGTITSPDESESVSSSFNHYGMQLTSEAARVYFYSFYDRFVITQGAPDATGANAFFVEGSGTLANVHNMGRWMVIPRSVTDKMVYLKYQVSGDINLTQYGIKFDLHELNTIGDQSCRTDSEDYEAGAEVGNCTSPPGLCTLFQQQKPLYGKVNIDVDIGGELYSSSHWFRSIRLTGISPVPFPCDASHLHGYKENGAQTIVDFWNVTFTQVCDFGVLVLEVDLYWNQYNISGGNFFNLLVMSWEVELSGTVTEPNEIPNTVLTEADAVYDGTGGWGVTVEINP